VVGYAGVLGFAILLVTTTPRLNGPRQNSLSRLGVLIPAEGLAREKRVAKPLESNEGVSASFGLSERGAEFLDAGIQVGGDDGLLAIVVLVVIDMIVVVVGSVIGRVAGKRTRSPLLARDSLAVANPLK